MEIELMARMPEDVAGDVADDVAGDVAAVGVESTLVEIRQALIDAGGDPTYVNDLGEGGIDIVLHMFQAGHSIPTLCPARDTDWYYRYDEYDEH